MLGLIANVMELDVDVLGSTVILRILHRLDPRLGIFESYKV